MQRRGVVVAAVLLLAGLAAGAAASDSHRITTFITQWPVTPSAALTGIAADGEGHVYVSTSSYTFGAVEVYDAEGTWLTRFCGVWGAGDGQCARTQGVAIGPDGLIYVSDDLNRRIQRFERSGSAAAVTFSYVSQFPVYTGSNPLSRTYPYRTSFDLSGNVFVAQYWGAEAALYDATGAKLQTIATYPRIYPNYILPIATAVDSVGNFYVSTHWALYSYQGGDFIYKYNPDGALIEKWGGHGTGDGQFNGLAGIAIDANDLLYACDQENHRIQAFTTDGTFLGWYGKGTLTSGWHDPGSGEVGVAGSGPGEFSSIGNIAFDPDGYIYTTEGTNVRVQKLYRNAAPSASFAGPSVLIVGEAGLFDGSASSDPDGIVALWEWDFGDGGTGAGETTSYSWAAPGAYTVTLTVTDDYGAEATAHLMVEVITAESAIAALQSLVTAVVPPVVPGLHVSLLAKLRAAIAYLDAGQTALAADALQSFIDHVTALSGKMIPVAAADQLIAEAQRILSTLM